MTTTYSIWEILANTPWWVYVLFVYLMWLGFSARKPRIVPIRSLFILPVILLVFSIIGLYQAVEINFYHISLWLVAMVVGVALGWLQYHSLKIKAVKNEYKLYVPGTWGLLIIILIIFSTKFYFGYELAIDPKLFLQSKHAFWLISIYGLFTGFFIGRLIYALQRVKHGPYFDASKTKSPLR